MYNYIILKIYVNTHAPSCLLITYLSAAHSSTNAGQLAIGKFQMSVLVVHAPTSLARVQQFKHMHVEIFTFDEEAQNRWFSFLLPKLKYSYFFIFLSAAATFYFS